MEHKSNTSLGAFLRNRRRQLPAHNTTIGPHPRLRDRIGRLITQEEIAEAIGVTRVWYASIETDAAPVSRRLFGRIADAFALEPAERLMLLQLAFPELAAA